MYRSSDLWMVPFDPQFTTGLVSVIDQIEPKRISWEEFERCFMEHPLFGEAFVAVMRELDGLIKEDADGT